MFLGSKKLAGAPGDSWGGQTALEVRDAMSYGVLELCFCMVTQGPGKGPP